jgi:penicillin-binding protein 2
MMETVTMSAPMRAKSKVDSLNSVSYTATAGEELLKKILSN